MVASTLRRCQGHSRLSVESTCAADIEAVATRDPDAPPLTEADLARLRHVPRRALGLTQEEFAARYHIPLKTRGQRKVASITLIMQSAGSARRVLRKQPRAAAWLLEGGQ